MPSYQEMLGIYGQDALDFALYPGPETRVVVCWACNGDGGGETTPCGVDTTTGVPISHWVACNVCDGHGEFEIEAQPITLDDLEDMGQ